MPFEKLLAAAKEKLGPRKVGKMGEAGYVAAALETEAGHIYTGVNIDVPCSMGFCAEHAAIAAMVTAGENRIVKLVAVMEDGSVGAPCGRCREFICQIHDDNHRCEVLLEAGRTATVGELLPMRWN